MRKLLPILSILLVASGGVSAQSEVALLSGIVVSEENGEPLPGVNVVLTTFRDSTLSAGAITDAAGSFKFEVTAPFWYRLRFSFVGFEPLSKTARVPAEGLDLGKLELSVDVAQLDQVVVEEFQDRIQIKGDTTMFNADAFKVNRDADAGELMAKLPGIVIENGNVQAQGENVSRVLVDGREFFGEDPTAALRNLPAEIVERVEVFDRLSDQAQLTGFNDGNTQKTINIVTRPGMSNGQFGKIYGGYGTEDRYQSGGNVNLFSDDRRLSLIGLGNNINQQNFANEDLLGVIGSAGRRRGGARGRGRGGGGRGRGDRGGMRPGNGPGGVSQRSNPSNFLVGEQGGITSTNALGFNYSDEWGSKVRLSGSYFFNNSGNTSDEVLDRQYQVSGITSQLYNESSYSESDNFNHRLNLRMNIDLDENNSFIITPRVSFQDNRLVNLLDGQNTSPSDIPINGTINDFASNNAGYTSSTNILYRRRLGKPGRTISVNIGLGLNDRWGDSSQLSSTSYYDETGALIPEELLDYNQRSDNQTAGTSISSRIAYTEPLGSGQLQFDYRPSFAKNVADQLTNQLDPTTGLYTIRQPSFSSQFDNDVFQQRGGISWRNRGERWMTMVGLNLQSEKLTGEQTLPTSFDVDRTFFSVLPMVMLQYRVDRTNNFRLIYRTSTNTPSIAQLQDVVDNTNPLFLSSGNPNLEPSYSNTLVARYNRTDTIKGRIFMGFLSLQQSSNYVGNAITLDTQDTELPQGLVVPAGSQYSAPVNLSGYWNARSLLTFGFPSQLLKSNVNLSAGASFSKTPGLFNEVETLSDVIGVNGGAVIGSNVSPELDFTLSYNGSFNTVNNSDQPELNNDYLIHTGSVRFKWLPVSQVSLTSQVAFSRYDGLAAEFTDSVVRWDIGIGYRFLKDRAGELKVIFADILDQNKNIARSVTDFYVEDTLTQGLGRYAMVNFTYQLRNFGR